MTHATQFALAHGAALLFIWILLQQAGLPIPGAPLLIAAGSLASSTRLGLASSLVAALSACLLADGFWYRIGRRGEYKGARFRRTNSNWKDRALSLIRGHSAVTLLLAKFIAGSNWASLLAGQAGISAARFVIYDSVGSLTLVWWLHCAWIPFAWSTALDASADFTSALHRSRRNISSKILAPQITGVRHAGTGHRLLCGTTCNANISRCLPECTTYSFKSFPMLTCSRFWP